MRQPRGFTLIELMVVVAIVMLLAAFFFSFGAESYRPNTEQLAEQISSDLNMVRTRALATRSIQQAEINFSVTPAEIDVYAAPTRGMAMTNFTSGTDEGVMRIELPANITVWSAVAGAQGSGASPSQITTGTYDIYFYPDGSATASTIYVTDRTNSKQYRVLVYHATGSSYARQYW